MNTLGILLGSLALGSGLGALAWRCGETRDAAEAARHAASSRQTLLAAQLRQWESELAQTKIRAEKAADAAPAASTVAASAAPAPRAANSLVEWLEDPAVQVLYFAKQRAELSRAYGPFFRAANLTEEQIERLSELIVETRAHSHDLSEIHRLKGVSFSDSEMRSERARAKEESRRRMVELLGASMTAKLEDYARALEVRDYVGRMAGKAAVENCPLSWQQADALAQLLANTCPEYPAGGRASMSKVDWKVVEARAGGILTPAQMMFLRADSPKAIVSRASSELGAAVHRVLLATGGMGEPRRPATRKTNSVSQN